MYCGHNNGNNHKIIEDFIKTYDVDYKKATLCADDNVSSAKQCAKKYTSMNDFFTRDIIIKKPHNYAAIMIVAPSDCYVIAFNNIKLCTKLWIKGKYFTIKKLLDLNKADKINIMLYNIIIFRLAPKHYHQIHAVATGTITLINVIKGRHLSVRPEIVNSIDVFSENVRTVLKIISPTLGTMYMIIIGATCVYSISFKNKKLQAAYDAGGSTMLNIPIIIGTKLGRFNYGGSTILLLTEKKYNSLNDMISYNSLLGIEVEINVLDKITK